MKRLKVQCHTLIHTIICKADTVIQPLHITGSVIAHVSIFRNYHAAVIRLRTKFSCHKVFDEVQGSVYFYMSPDIGIRIPFNAFQNALMLTFQTLDPTKITY